MCCIVVQIYQSGANKKLELHELVWPFIYWSGLLCYYQAEQRTKRSSVYSLIFISFLEISFSAMAWGFLVLIFLFLIFWPTLQICQQDHTSWSFYFYFLVCIWIGQLTRSGDQKIRNRRSIFFHWTLSFRLHITTWYILYDVQKYMSNINIGPDLISFLFF